MLSTLPPLALHVSQGSFSMKLAFAVLYALVCLLEVEQFGNLVLTTTSFKHSRQCTHLSSWKNITAMSFFKVLHSSVFKVMRSSVLTSFKAMCSSVDLFQGNVLVCRPLSRQCARLSTSFKAMRSSVDLLQGIALICLLASFKAMRLSVLTSYKAIRSSVF